MTSVGVSNHHQTHLHPMNPHQDSKPSSSNRSSSYIVNSLSKSSTALFNPTIRPSSPFKSLKNLRVLLVDDNLINLKILNTLLNRRFGSFLAHAPIAVDSGLKALQQLRYQVFDVIFMDIQMPFLSGLECCKRIRAGESGIISVNREAHIVAVTTCNAAEASATYHQNGFSGLIAKPVRFQDLSDFILPLSKEAFLAEGSVEKINSFGKLIFPPLPPTSIEGERAYFDTTNSTILSIKPSTSLDEELLEVENGNSSSASISNSENFAILLAAQTRGSLRMKNEFFDHRNGGLKVSSSSGQSSRGSFSSDEPPVLAKFDKELFADQVADELEAAKIFDSDQLNSSQTILEESNEQNGQATIRPSSALARRKLLLHRLSSPAFLLGDSSPTLPESEGRTPT